MSNYRQENELNFENELELFDFSKISTNAGWLERSDTIREVGMSKADLTIQKTRLYQRAVLFTMLNPQPNGAGFAGVRIFTSLDLKKYYFLALKVRGQGENYHYKIILRHQEKNDEPYPTYEQFFKVMPNEFQIISLPLCDFKPYYRGKESNSAELLDKTQITSVGIQVYGGLHLQIKQSGTSSLEIEWIRAAVTE